ncbi:phosphoribosyltransferase [Helicobacter salomonis]|uniref:phosphoribosyltransferase n=1 Tax=Helicobacter salomonis TaxID=56878 RepID=UPI000CF17FBF|nr:phosphoribosyltransferase family protein [Helicobacter salomonis]
MTQTLFKDYQDALHKLINEVLVRHLDTSDAIMLATSLKGLQFAHALAMKLRVDLDFLFSGSIYAPLNRECEIALVSETMGIIMHENLIQAFEISLDYVYGEAKRIYEEEILSKIYKFRKGNMLKSLAHKNVFIVDQGIETGITAGLAIQTCMDKRARSIIVLAPIIPKAIEESLNHICDGVVSVYHPEHFVSIAHYYKCPLELDLSQIERIFEAIVNYPSLKDCKQ